MSTTTTRWSSSAKPTHAPVLLPTRKSTTNSLINNQHTFIQRTAKTRHDVEQLFKLYCTNNLKYNTFQRQVVTGTRIPSAQNHFNETFQTKHNVSQEGFTDIEQPKIPNKRTLQIRLDHNPPPPLAPSTSPSLDITPELSCSDLLQPDELNENPVIQDSLEQNSMKKNGPSIIGLPPVPSSTLTLMNNRKDIFNTSHSSFSTMNSIRTKSSVNKQRIKSSTQYSSIKTNPVSIRFEQPDQPVFVGARVVSIPSKCSRYVLLTFPRHQTRYNIPSYVERILLPERFPALYNNIIQNRQK